jgi:hypothetical protein
MSVSDGIIKVAGGTLPLSVKKIKRLRIAGVPRENHPRNSYPLEWIVNVLFYFIVPNFRRGIAFLIRLPSFALCPFLQKNM